MSGPDWFNMIAVERGLPVDWTWFKSEWKGDGKHAVMLVKGGVAGAVFTRGPKKGKPNPAKRTNVAEIVVTRADLSRIKEKWELGTGKCAECTGSGAQVVSWSKTDGTKTNQCRRCYGLGSVADWRANMDAALAAGDVKTQTEWVAKFPGVHCWFVFKGLASCASCGVVRPHDGIKAGACRGIVKVELR